MRTKKAIITAALAVPMLALGGGLAYASTTAGSPPPATRTAITTVAPTTHPAGQANHNGHRYDHRCDWQGNRHQQATRHQPARHGGYRHDYGQHGRGHMGDWGYQGSGQYRTGSQWSNGGGCCGDGH